MTAEARKRIAARIEERLMRLFRAGAAEPRSSVFTAPPGSELLDQVRELTLRGGKRIRPALLTCGAALFEDGAEDDPAVIDAGAALELLHAYFLIHDDIMDDDSTRRGGPAVHAALAARTGSPKLGRDLAILAGDLAAALHEGLLANLPGSTDRRLRATRIFAEMHLDVVHGQTLDLLGRAGAEEVASRKTASYTTVGPLTAGAALGGAGDDEIELLAAIASPLGVAFQLRDDILGAFGSAESTGKPIGTDIRKGKKTLLIEEALARAGPDERAAIDAALGREDATVESIGAASDALRTSGALRACEDRITELVTGAMDLVRARSFREQGVELLTDLTDFLARRDR
jgi:geranylgeranyl diphosphate synthase type I